MPRIIQRAPRIGDVHPLSKRKLAGLLSRLPIELYYGLKIIEMRARQGEVGHPFAAYNRAAKTIRLYSLPMTIHAPHVTRLQRQLFAVSGATVEQRPEGYQISWPNLTAMGFWFYYDVFIHELGHHHRFQYPSKTGPPGRPRDEEFLADRYRYWVGSGRFSPSKGRPNKVLQPSALGAILKRRG